MKVGISHLLHTASQAVPTAMVTTMIMDHAVVTVIQRAVQVVVLAEEITIMLGAIMIEDQIDRIEEEIILTPEMEENSFERFESKTISNVTYKE